MKKLPCSIFNDVIGPVMRGPSSSHVAGGARIAELVRQSFTAPVKKVTVDFDPSGALAASHYGHGTDMGFACGLMGMDLSDPGVDQYERLARECGIEIQYRVMEYGAVHPGNYRIHAEAKDGAVHDWEAISTGGGMIEMQKLDGFGVNICGDFYEILVVVDCEKEDLKTWIGKLSAMLPAAEFCLESPGTKIGTETGLINWKMARPVEQETVEAVKRTAGVMDVITLEPILPTHSRADCDVPFSSAGELLEYAKEHPADTLVEHSADTLAEHPADTLAEHPVDASGYHPPIRRLDAWEYAVLYESIRGNMSSAEVLEKMDAIYTVMEQAVDQGLAGTSYKDRILGPQAHKVEEQERQGKLIPCNLMSAVIRNITAVMEVKSSMGLIVAAPIVGSCGCLPGTVIGLGRELGLSRKEIIQGLLTAGLIGVWIAEAATFSAEVAGCQVECGAASGMTAAAVTQMMGGSVEQCIDAASMAMQNITGLACDPVANRVEVPCLGKNVMGGFNALASADMALAGFDAVIPLDETITAIYKIGLSLPLELRCTCGGLGKTKTSMEIMEEMKRK